MRGVKLAITVMTTLIFIGMGLLIYGVATKSAELGLKAKAPPPVQDLALPVGAKIEHMSPWREGMALHLSTPKGEYIFLLRSDGTVASKLAIRHSADALPAAQ